MSNMTKQDGTLAARIGMLVSVYGSLRAVARERGIDVAYLKRLVDGDKVNPSDTVLKKLNLVRHVTYRLWRTK